MTSRRQFFDLLCIIAVLIMGLAMGFMLAEIFHYPIPRQPTPTPNWNDPIQIGMLGLLALL